MSEMTGYEFLETVHSDDNASRVPVVILTSAILGIEERNLLRHAARIISKSDLSAAMLTEAIEGVRHPPDVALI
jgi:CheY-like chemotaxis protein